MVSRFAHVWAIFCVLPSASCDQGQAAQEQKTEPSVCWKSPPSWGATSEEPYWSLWVYIYMYIYIYVYIYMWTLFKFRPNLPACPMYPICCAFWHVSQDLLPQQFLTLYSYFEIFWKSPVTGGTPSYRADKYIHFIWSALGLSWLVAAAAATQANK